MNKVTKIQKIDKNASIGKKIQYLRTNKGIKQEDLADEIGVTRYMLGKYEDDKTSVPAEKLEKITEALDTSINYLLGLTESQSPNIEEQEIVKITGLNDKAISILKELKKFAPSIIDTINYLIEQEEVFPINDFSYLIPDNATEEEKEKIQEEAEEKYNKAVDFWNETHFDILSKITDYYDTNIADKMLYITKENDIKNSEEFSTEFQKNIHTRKKVSLKDLVNMQTLKDIMYQLQSSKENKQKNNMDKNKMLEKYLKECNSIKIKRYKKGEDKICM